MPTALQVAGPMVALLFFIFQDAAEAGKSTCNSELDIDMPLPQNGEKLLQARTSPEVSAAELEKVQCQCVSVIKKGKCKGPDGFPFKESLCNERSNSRDDCEGFRERKKGKRACKWEPTPAPTPVPTPEPTPEPTSCLDTLPPKSTYKEYKDAKCKAGSARSHVDTFQLGIATGSAKVDPDCGRVCDWFPWCRAYTQLYIINYLNSKPQPERLYTCDMLVDEKIWAVDPVVAEESKKWTWNAEGETYPSDMKGQPRKFDFPRPCPQDLDLWGKNLTLSSRCGSSSCSKAYESVYGNGAHFPFKGWDSTEEIGCEDGKKKTGCITRGNIVRGSCFQKE